MKIKSIKLFLPDISLFNFRQMRHKKGYTMRYIEEKTGISNAYLSQLETGKIKCPSYTTVKTLYDFYNSTS